MLQNNFYKGVTQRLAIQISILVMSYFISYFVGFNLYSNYESTESYG